MPPELHNIVDCQGITLIFGTTSVVRWNNTPRLFLWMWSSNVVFFTWKKHSSYNTLYVENNTFRTWPLVVCIYASSILYNSTLHHHEIWASSEHYIMCMQLQIINGSFLWHRMMGFMSNILPGKTLIASQNSLGRRFIICKDKFALPLIKMYNAKYIFLCRKIKCLKKNSYTVY